jgi:hypothetical protein
MDSYQCYQVPGKRLPLPQVPTACSSVNQLGFAPIFCRRDGLAPFLAEILGSGLSSNVNLAKKSQQRSSEVLRVTKKIEARNIRNQVRMVRPGANRV